MTEAHQNKPKSGVNWFLVLLSLLVFAAATLYGMYSEHEKAELRPYVKLHQQTMPQSSLKRSASGDYLVSQIALQRRDYQVAAASTAALLEKRPDDPVLMVSALRQMVAAGDYATATSLAEKLEQTMPDDSLASLVLAGVYSQKGEFAAGLKELEVEEPRGMFSLIQPILMQWMRVGQMQGGTLPSEPIVTIESVDLDGFLGALMQYQRGLMNDYLGFTDEAADAFGAATENPMIMPLRVVQAFANLRLREGDVEAAKALYARYETYHPDSQLVPEAIPHSETPAADIPPFVGNVSEGLAEMYFTAASILYGDSDNEDTLIFVRLALMLKPDFPPAQTMLANLLEQNENHEGAVAAYQAIRKDSPFYERGRLRIALNYRAAGQNDDAIAMLKGIIENAPDQIEAAILLGDIYRQDEKYRAAAASYGALLNRVSADELDWEFYYKYGIALERDGQWDKAEAQFKRALELESDQPDVLNYLGYSWLVQGRNLEEAKEAIYKAYEQRPDQAHIIDSMGWAYYMLGDYERALIMLEQATDLAPQDPTINEHLGDVYWQVGREREARFQWERALVFDPEDPEAIKQKLEQGLTRKSAPLPINEAEDEADEASDSADANESE